MYVLYVFYVVYGIYKWYVMYMMYVKNAVYDIIIVLLLKFSFYSTFDFWKKLYNISYKF